MRRKIEKFKELFLTIARSSVINWTIFLIMIVGIVFNLFNGGFYKTVGLFVCLEVMFINANTYKIRFVEDEEATQNYKDE